jgi:hypothetical protein
VVNNNDDDNDGVVVVVRPLRESGERGGPRLVRPTGTHRQLLASGALVVMLLAVVLMLLLLVVMTMMALLIMAGMVLVLQPELTALETTNPLVLKGACCACSCCRCRCCRPLTYCVG